MVLTIMGIVMLATLFIGIFAVIIKEMGLKAALKIFGMALLSTAWVIVAAILMSSGIQ